MFLQPSLLTIFQIICVYLTFYSKGISLLSNYSRYKYQILVPQNPSCNRPNIVFKYLLATNYLSDTECNKSLFSSLILNIDGANNLPLWLLHPIEWSTSFSWNHTLKLHLFQVAVFAYSHHQWSAWQSCGIPTSVNMVISAWVCYVRTLLMEWDGHQPGSSKT